MNFSQNDFTAANFFKTSLSGIDLSNCEIASILVSENLSELKGASINITQAADIVKYIGIKIKDGVLN